MAEQDPIRRLLRELVPEGDLAPLSRQIGKNHAYLQQFLTRGTPKTLSEEVREALAPLLGLDPDDLHPGRSRRRTVPIVGYAGAGPDGQVLFAEGDGQFGEAPLPPGGGEKTVAVEVRGDSMRGIAEEGWRVYYDDRRDPPNESHIGKVCVVGLRDGRVLVKKLYRGRGKGLYDLESYNAPTMHDVPVEWAALVTAILPEYAARRMDRKNGNGAA